jgi:hypothetical protein
MPLWMRRVDMIEVCDTPDLTIRRNSEARNNASANTTATSTFLASHISKYDPLRLYSETKALYPY